MTTIHCEQRYRNAWDGSVASMQCEHDGTAYNLWVYRGQGKPYDYWASVAIYWGQSREEKKQANRQLPANFQGSRDTPYAYSSRKEAISEGIRLAEELIAEGLEAFKQSWFPSLNPERVVNAP